MGDIKLGEPFGMDLSGVSKADWTLALQRIIHDLRSDFIYAPHLGFIYRKAGEELVEIVKRDLKDGQYKPGLPLTIEVPKSYRIRVSVNPPRLGPAYSRPGSILMPKDRLFYQLLADKAAPIIEAKTDVTRSFSHRLEDEDSPSMFKPTRACWAELQKALARHSGNRKNKYVLKIDVANFFGSVNQHTLINVLADAGYPPKFLTRLEALLTAYTGERSSRGILQGIYPSDLLGNFYMEPIDRFLADQDIPSARYVDDLYIFLGSVDASERLMRDLIPELRRYDLVLNEAKSAIMPKAALNTEEPDLEALFEEAVEEISKQVDDEDFDADYGFQSEWEHEEEEKEEEYVEDGDDEGLELEATMVLFDSIDDHPGHEEAIERFCLPLFAKAASNYAVDHVLEAFKKRPSMSQIYVSYLAKFLPERTVYQFLCQSLEDRTLVDWQTMWILAALITKKPSDEAPIKAALQILKDGTVHDATRAAAAIYVGRYGDATRRRALLGVYGSVSIYVQAAIYFASRYWPRVERLNAKAQWGALNPLNELLTKAFAN
ncbi:RNA-directed DNA polymerase [Sinorhizobium americanum]|uniref:Reverse transcriptase (RNA-dependent DNA polymerase) n=1 Tax=Sinorhizobium americanum TaxID=194963 RepID=A0A4R2C354_9HYPH|nr:RNA-directed DNA polymerase [Sinorhizobium americanum]TCN34075.1 reverse transcriptase (RNA-dependent DNA polymerase) [Sinorhizobium americanum]